MIKLVVVTGIISLLGFANREVQTAKPDCTPLRTLSTTDSLEEPNTDTLVLKYVIWGCSCPNWITESDYIRYENSAELIKHCFYLESSGARSVPDNFSDPEHQLVRVIGHFSKDERIPAYLLDSEEPPSKARIFHFTSIEVIAN